MGRVLQALPIFPLPDTVLFPGALLPLHVFEPRYRELTADVIAGDRMMAIARLRPGYEVEYHGRPPVVDVVGVGRLVQHEALPDGRSNILLRGIGRARIEEEAPPSKAYRIVRARLLDEATPASDDDLAAARAQLVTLCDALAAAMPEGGDMLRSLARSVDEPGGSADVIASAVVIGGDERQELLEMTDPAARLERVLEHVATLLVRFRGPGASGGGRN